MLAVFEIEESYNELMKDIQKLKNYDTSGDDLTR